MGVNFSQLSGELQQKVMARGISSGNVPNDVLVSIMTAEIGNVKLQAELHGLLAGEQQAPEDSYVPQGKPSFKLALKTQEDYDNDRKIALAQIAKDKRDGNWGKAFWGAIEYQFMPTGPEQHASSNLIKLLTVGAFAVATLVACETIPEDVKQEYEAEIKIENDFTFEDNSTTKVTVNVEGTDYSGTLLEIVTALKDAGKTLQTILEALQGAGQSLDAIIDTLKQSGESLEKIYNAVVANGTKLDTLIELVKNGIEQNSANNLAITQRLDEIITELQNGNKIDAKTQELIIQVLAKLDNLATMGENEKMLLEKVLTTIKAFMELEEGANTKTQKLLETIIEKLNTLGETGAIKLDAILDAINNGNTIALKSQAILQALLDNIGALQDKGDKFLTRLDHLITLADKYGNDIKALLEKILEKIPEECKCNPADILIKLENIITILENKDKKPNEGILDDLGGFLDDK